MFATYLALFIYLIILGIITWSSAQKKDVRDFLFASNDIGWKQLALSIFSSVISSYNIVLTLTFSFLYGPYFLLIFIGSLAAFIGIYFISKKHKDIIQQRGFNNIIDIFSYLFDRKVATVLNLSFIVVLYLFIIVQFFINTSIFSELLGWNKYISSLFVGITVLSYTIVGGLKAEIFTDVFQGILMFLIIVLVFMVDTSAITFDIVGKIITDKSLLIGALCLGASQFLTLLVQPELWQRVVAAKNSNHIKKGFIAAYGLITLFIIPEIIIGLSARASGTITDPSNLFYDVLAVSAPGWFLPFLCVGLFAAFMSTLDSSLFAIASQLGKYGIGSVKDTDNNNQSIKLHNEVVAKNTRLSIIIVTITGLGLSLFLANFLSAVFGLISLLTVISVVIAISLIFKIPSNQTLISLLVGIVIYAYLFFMGYITQEPITSLYPSFCISFYIAAQMLFVSFFNKIRN